MRPLLKPALRRVWRDSTTLQFGLDPERAVVVSGLDVAAARFVDDLDGTRDEAQLLAHATSLGLAPERAVRLLSLLAGCGVLDDARSDRRRLSSLPIADRDRLEPDVASLSLTHSGQDGGVAALQRRRGCVVGVLGAGRVGAAVASLLAAAGVGHVLPEDPGTARASDTGPAGLTLGAIGAPRQEGAVLAMRRLAPAVQTTLPGGRSRPDLVVLAPTVSVHPAVPDRLLRQGIPHLSVTVLETVGLVGPLVLPGRSSCLRCADLHRTGRDPAWPRVVAQLAARRGGDAAAACDSALATLVAAQAVLQVLAMLDGTATPAVVDGTLETRLPEGITRRRSWTRHPACGCSWAEAG